MNYLLSDAWQFPSACRSLDIGFFLIVIGLFFEGAFDNDVKVWLKKRGGIKRNLKYHKQFHDFQGCVMFEMRHKTQVVNKPFMKSLLDIQYSAIQENKIHR